MKPVARRDLLIRAAGASALASVAVAPAGAADPFPTRPVCIIVTSAPGGWIDVTTRVFAQRMSEQLGQQVVVENRTGAGGVVAIRSMKPGVTACGRSSRRSRGSCGGGGTGRSPSRGGG